MKLRTGGAVFATALIALTADGTRGEGGTREPLNAYRVAPTAENKQKLALRRLRHDGGRPRVLSRGLRDVQAGVRAGARKGSRPSSSAKPTRRPRRPPTYRSAATPISTSGAAMTACPTTARSSTSSSTTGSRA